MDAEALFQQALAYSAEMAGQYGYVVEEDLAVRTLNRAVVTPRRYFANRSYTGAVYDGSGALVQSTLRFNVQDIVPVDPPVLPALEAIAALDRHHDQAIYGGILFPILGHFCFETLGRFWPLVTLARRAREGGRAVPLFFHHWPGLDVAAFFQTPFYQFVFERFGIGRADVVIIDRPMSFGTLLVPDAASIYHVKLSTEMRRVFDFVAAAPDGRLATGRGRRMAYLSRSRWTDNRRVSNEMELEAELARRGFEIVHTQDLAPRALLDLLQDTDTLLTTDGSHAHLAAFCQPGARSVMLDTRPVPTQIAIEKLRGIGSVHIPLYLGPLYTNGLLNDVPLLGTVIDRALAHLAAR